MVNSDSALELTDRSRALYAGLDRAWDQAANGLFAARAAISAGDEERSIEACNDVEHWLQAVDDPWLHARRDAVLGELARLQHRFDDAVIHIGRAVETSGRLGFLQTEAYQTASLGRAQCQAGDYDTGAATLELAIERQKPPATHEWRHSPESISGACCAPLDNPSRRAPHSRPLQLASHSRRRRTGRTR